MSVPTLQHIVKVGLDAIDGNARRPGFKFDRAIETYTNLTEKSEVGSDEWIMHSAYLVRCLWHQANPAPQPDPVERKDVLDLLERFRDSLNTTPMRVRATGVIAEIKGL